MSLYYITRVGIPSQAAQSVQIASMCKAFHGLPGKDFKFISSLSKNNTNLTKDYDWEKIETVFAGGVFKYLVFSVKVFFKLLKDRPTHIYSRDIIVALIGQKLGLQSVYETHKVPNSLTAKLLIKYLLRKNNFKLVSISKSLKDYYVKHYSAADNKILVSHDGVFIEKYEKLRSVDISELRRKISIPPQKTVVMHTGSLYPGRGADLFGIIADAFPDILFLHVGGTEHDVEKWKKYYESHDNIVIIPHQNNETLVKYQMSANLLFLPMTKNTPTWWCASPMKLFEYMAAGKPILASNIGSVKEVLNENNAILFDPEIPDTIINGVDFFINRPDTCEKLAQQALREVREKYTWEKRASSICKFLGASVEQKENNAVASALK